MDSMDSYTCVSVEVIISLYSYKQFNLQNWHSCVYQTLLIVHAQYTTVRIQYVYYIYNVLCSSSVVRVCEIQKQVEIWGLQKQEIRKPLCLQSIYSKMLKISVKSTSFNKWKVLPGVQYTVPIFEAQYSLSAHSQNALKWLLIYSSIHITRSTARSFVELRHFNLLISSTDRSSLARFPLITVVDGTVRARQTCRALRSRSRRAAIASYAAARI